MFRKPRDKRGVFSRFCLFLRERSQSRAELRRAPRTLAEALRDSGALSMPERPDRFTGSREVAL